MNRSVEFRIGKKQYNMTRFQIVAVAVILAQAVVIYALFSNTVYLYTLDRNLSEAVSVLQADNGQLSYSLSSLTRLFLNSNEPPTSPPINSTWAVQTGIGWTTGKNVSAAQAASAVANGSVTMTLDFAYMSSMNGSNQIIILGQVERPVASYSPIEVGGRTYVYVWIVTLANHTPIYIDASDGEIWNMSFGEP